METERTAPPPSGDELQRGLGHDLLLLGAMETLHQAGPVVKDTIANWLPKKEPDPPKVILPRGVDADK